MDYSKLEITHYPISEFKNFADFLYAECSHLGENWSNDESLDCSLAYLVRHRLDFFTITKYDGEFINFSSIYKYDDWIVGGVRGFGARGHNTRVFQPIWTTHVLPSQCTFGKEQYPDSKGFMFTFSKFKNYEILQHYFDRHGIANQEAAEFWNSLDISKEPETFQYTKQYILRKRF